MLRWQLIRVVGRNWLVIVIYILLDVSEVVKLDCGHIFHVAWHVFTSWLIVDFMFAQSLL